MKDYVADEGIKKNHKLFEKQLLELEQERLSLFGSNGGAEDDISSLGSADGDIVNLEEKSPKMSSKKDVSSEWEGGKFLKGDLLLT